MNRIQFFLKTLSFVVLLILIYLVFLNILKVTGFSVQQTKTFIQNLQGFGIIAIEILLIIAVITPFPEAPFALISTVVYGPIVGFFLILIAFTIGSIINFYLFRRFFRNIFIQKKPIWNENLNIITQKYGSELIMFLKSVPTVSFDYVSYIFSLSRIKFKNFVIASFLGSLPLSLTYLLIGINVESSENIRLILNTVFAFLILGCLILFRKYSKYKLNDLEKTTDDNNS